MALTADQARRLARVRHVPNDPHHRYSRFVRIMKILLPALAVSLLGLVVVWPRLRFDDTRFRIGFAKLSPDQVQTLAMDNPRYFGIDQNNRPFTLIANRASQEDGQPDVIDLTQPKGDFSTKDGSNVSISGERGYYHQKAQLLDLEGAVSLYHDKGYELHTERAEINLADSSAHGDAPVHGQGPQGLLAGEGFRISNKGADVLVTGRSQLSLQGAGAAAPGRKRGK